MENCAPKVIGLTGAAAKEYEEKAKERSAAKLAFYKESNDLRKEMREALARAYEEGLGVVPMKTCVSVYRGKERILSKHCPRYRDRFEYAEGLWSRERISKVNWILTTIEAVNEALGVSGEAAA